MLKILSLIKSLTQKFSSRNDHNCQYDFSSPKLPKLSEAELQELKAAKEYISPYRTKCPYPTVVIYNRSGHANNHAITQLKKAWPELRIIQALRSAGKNEKEDQLKHPLADETVTIDSWDKPDLLWQKLNEKFGTHSFFQEDIGIHCVWSAQAEDAEVARSAINSGFKWIGARPEAMDALDKVGYKHLCQQQGVSTAPFIELESDRVDIETLNDDYINLLTRDFMSKYVASPELNEGAVFMKSAFGGGGRGTVKVSDPQNEDEVKSAIKKVITDTGRTDKVYAEKALDLRGATLFQLELEVNGTEVVPGGRLVWFNPENQKVLEIGLSDSEITKFIGAETYLQAREETRKLAIASGYDNRGTNEVLICRKPKIGCPGEFEFQHFGSEFNCRLQVENRALSGLVVDKDGHEPNGVCTQVMVSAGFSPPKEKELWAVNNVVAHIRLVNVQPKEKGGWEYEGGSVETAVLPPALNMDDTLLITKGKINRAVDAQVGAVLITADSWEHFCEQLKMFGTETVLSGEKLEKSTYLPFLAKLGSDRNFIGKARGCNQTSGVIPSPPVSRSDRALITEGLANGVVPLLMQGYKPDPANTIYPSDQDLAQLHDLQTRLEAKGPIPESDLMATFRTPTGIDAYYAKLAEVCQAQGGALINVYPRDSKQESGMSQSTIISHVHNLVMGHIGSMVGFVGNETGGAKFDVSCMDGFDWFKVFTDEINSAVPMRSLVRSNWLNSLVEKTPGEIRFILTTMANAVRKKLGIADGQPVPWFPNNFHAGNHPDQDLVTKIALEVGMTPVPNFVWHEKFTDDNVRDWTKRQIQLFRQQGRDLRELRIKNPGQGPSWTVDKVWNMMNIMREECRLAGLPDPFIHIHNHNMAQNKGGLENASSIAFNLLKKAQQEDFRQTIIDTAPPETTHNTNTAVASALELSAEQRQGLQDYNEACRILEAATIRFDLKEKLRHIPADTIWAGGTGSSDIASADKIRLPHEQISVVEHLASEVFQLGGIVTPYSEILKRLGYAAWQTYEEHKLDPEPQDGSLRLSGLSAQKLTSYIDAGGRLPVDDETLSQLQKWRTLIPRPPVVETLLRNHGWALQPNAGATVDNFSLEQTRAALMQQYPNIPEITDEIIATAIGFGGSGKTYLTALNEGRSLTEFLDQAHFLLKDPKDFQVGDSFTYKGTLITIRDFQINAATGYFTYSFELGENGPIIPITRLNKDFAYEHGIMMKPTLVMAGDATRKGSPYEGTIQEIKVSPGTQLTENTVVAVIEVSKQKMEIKAGKSLAGKVVRSIYVEPGESVDHSQLLFDVES